MSSFKPSTFYTVSIEGRIEIVETCGADGEVCHSNCEECPFDAVKVARIVNTTEESQEELIQELVELAMDGKHNAKALTELFTITRKS